MKNIILAIFITICLIFINCGQDEKSSSIKEEPVEQKTDQSTEMFRPIYSVSVSELAASSFLKDENNYFRYHPWKALDGDPTSAWNEAAEGAGQGEYLQIVFDKKIIIDKLTIMPG